MKLKTELYDVLIDAIEAGKLTDSYTKTFIREARTLNSVKKDELHRQYNELYDRLKLYEDMYFEAFSRADELFDTCDNATITAFCTTPDAPVPPELVTVTYAEDRLRYFEQERTRAKWRYETTAQSLKDAKSHGPWHDEEMSDAGRELQFYDDVVAMLKAEMEKQEAAKCEND